MYRGEAGRGPTETLEEASKRFIAMNKGELLEVPILPNEAEGKKQVGGNHYSKMVITPTNYILANKMGWLEGNVIKYVSRHQDKNGIEDLKKAIHYLELIIEEEYR